MEIKDRIKHEINQIKPFLQNDGGDIEFIDYEDGKVYIKLTGACSNCPMIDITIKEGIENILKNKISEIKEVIKKD